MICKHINTCNLSYLFAALFLLPALLIAEPHQFFGNNGSYVWSASDPWLHDIFTLNEGRALLTWSENQPSDGYRQIYRQIIDSEGAVVFNPPQVISNPEYFTTHGAAGEDAEGNIVVAWIAVSPNDSTTGMVMAQKYDLDGNPLWGQEARELYELPIDLRLCPAPLTNKFSSEFIIRNGIGGFYYITRNGVLSVDSDGQLDENWPHSENCISSDTLLYQVAEDEEGGFWLMTIVDGGDHTIHLVNHYFANGDKLWDNFQELTFAEYPYIEIQDFVCLRGRLIVGYEIPNDHQHGICVFDERGQLLGDEYIHHVEGYIRMMSKTLDGKVLVITDSHTVSLFSYNPDANNVFLLCDGGNFLDNIHDYQYSFYFVSECDDNGNIILSAEVHDFECGTIGDRFMQTWFYKFDSQGRQLWDEPFKTQLLYYRVIKADGQGGFWKGRSTINNAPMFGNNIYPGNFNRINADGDPYVPAGIDPGIGVRSDSNINYAWFGPDFHYRLLFNCNGRVVMRTMDSNGNVIGDPRGETVMQFNSIQGSMVKVLPAGERIIVITNGYANDDQGELKLCAMDIRGQNLWELSLPEALVGLSNVLNDHFEATISHDHRYLYLYTDISVDDNVDLNLYLIDLVTGSLDWRTEVGSFAGYPGLRPIKELTEAREVIHCLYSNEYDVASLVSINRDGQVVNDLDIASYFNPSDKLIGITPEADGGLWVGIIGHNEAGLRLISEQGELTDEVVSFYPGVRLEVPEPRPDFKYILKTIDGTVWFSQNTNMLSYSKDVLVPIQAVLSDRSLLFDPTGLAVHLPDNAYCPLLEFAPCEDGDIFLSWHFVTEDNGNWTRHDRVSLVNSDGRFVEGWDSCGVATSDNPTIHLDTIYPFGIDNLLVVRETNSRFTLQHISNSPRQDVFESPKNNPSIFEITSVCPNPFNGVISIGYSLPKAGVLSLKLFDVEGREVYQRELNVRSGSGVLTINMDNFSTGLYFARLEHDGISVTRNLMLLK